MALRSLASRVGLRLMMEGNLRSSSYSLRYFSDGKGRVLSKETVYIQIEENGERKVGEAQEEGGSGKT
ncbi:hypothetical protein SASPL_111503 [Salvia splendens]|uniref:Uncharacterized protein n=1 Tax=Salvia splendens TaxID=180675 RepID=A0A8X8YCL6_SALSN|nr:hypothetical protein SASPL_111503 [Salvia splendens]